MQRRIIGNPANFYSDGSGTKGAWKFGGGQASVSTGSTSNWRSVQIDTSAAVPTGPENSGRTTAERIYRRVS